MRKQQAWRAVLGLWLVGFVGGCTAFDEPSSPAPVTVTVTEPASSPAASPTSEVAAILLTDQGIGPIAFADGGRAYERLVDMLGPPSEPPAGLCGDLERGAYASWGGLTAYLADLEEGGLVGWSLRGGPLADPVVPPLGVYPGQTLQPVLEAGGETRPDDEEEGSFGPSLSITHLGRYWWESDGDEPDATVESVHVEAAGCD